MPFNFFRNMTFTFEFFAYVVTLVSWSLMEYVGFEIFLIEKLLIEVFHMVIFQ